MFYTPSSTQNGNMQLVQRAQNHKRKTGSNQHQRPTACTPDAAHSHTTLLFIFVVLGPWSTNNNLLPCFPPCAQPSPAQPSQAGSTAAATPHSALQRSWCDVFNISLSIFLLAHLLSRSKHLCCCCTAQHTNLLEQMISFYRHSSPPPPPSNAILQISRRLATPNGTRLLQHAANNKNHTHTCTLGWVKFIRWVKILCCSLLFRSVLRSPKTLPCLSEFGGDLGQRKNYVWNEVSETV